MLDVLSLIRSAAPSSKEAVKSSKNPTGPKTLPPDVNPGYPETLQALLSGLGLAPELGVFASQEAKDLARNTDLASIISDLVPGKATAAAGTKMLMAGSFLPSGARWSTNALKQLTETLAERRATIPEKELSEMFYPVPTKKELSLYGTPESPLDKFLESTRTNNNDLGVTPLVREVTPDPFTSKKILAGAEHFAESGDANKLQFAVDYDKEATQNIQDLMYARRDNVPLYSFGDGPFNNTVDSNAAALDIELAYEHITNLAAKYNIPYTQKTTLNQMLPKIRAAHETEQAALAKTKEAKEAATKGRSQEKTMLHGFVELDEPLDLSDETEWLNNCIGAIGSDKGKFIPAYNIVTGMPNKPNGPNSFESYYNNLLTGQSKYFSYRPNHLPEFTVEVDSTKLGKGTVLQAYGRSNATLTDEQQKALDTFLNSPEFTTRFRSDK